MTLNKGLLPRAIQFCQLERNIFVSNSRDAERDGGSAAVTPQNTREEFPRPLFQLWTEVGSRQWVVQPQLGTRIQCSSISAHEFKWKWCPDCLYIYIMPGFLCIPGDCLPLVTQLAGGQLLGSGSTIEATSFTTDQHRHTWLVASLIQCIEL